MRKLVVFVGLRGAAAVAGFLLTFVIAKVYPEEVSGEVFYFMSLMLSVSAIGRLGGDVQLVRQSSALVGQGQEHQARSVLFVALAMSAVVSFVAVVVLWLLGERVGILPAGIDYLLVAIGSVATGVLFATTEQLKAFLKLNRSILLQGVFPPLLVMVLLALFTGVAPVSLSVTLAYCVAAFVALGSVISVGGAQWAAGRSVVYDYVRGAISYAPKAIAAYVYPQLPVLVAGAWLAAGDVKAVSVIIKVGMVIGLPVVAINAYIAPKIARAHGAERGDELRILYSKVMKYSLVSGVILSLLAVTLSFNILRFFEIDSGSGYWLALSLVIIGQLVNAATGPSSIFAAMMRLDPILNMASLLLVGAFFVFLFLVSLFYESGFAVLAAYSIAMIIENVIVWLSVRNRLGRISA